MANEKNNKPATNELDLAAFLSGVEGFSADDFKITGGLTPIYGAKEAFENKLAPVIGWIDRLLVLPEVQQGKNPDGSPRVFEPHMILVREIQKATMGLQGSKDAKKLVDVAAGSDILVPITGNVETNRELIQALMDRKNKYMGVFACVGQQRVNNQVTPMWVWKILVATDKPSPRQGAYAILPTSAERQKLDGSIYHANGDKVDNVIEHRA